MQTKVKFLQSQHQNLKVAYPDVQKRKFFAEKKLKNCPLKNPFVLRIQPIKRYFHQQQQKIKYITLLVQGSTLMAQVNANVSKQLGLSSSTALFLTYGSSLVGNTKRVTQLAQLNTQEDRILYFGYADQDPFGGIDQLNRKSKNVSNYKGYEKGRIVNQIIIRRDNKSMTIAFNYLIRRNF